MASTASDLARWASIYYRGEHFSDSLLQKIITPNSQGKNLGPNQAYGMGSFVFNTPHGMAYGHTGFVPGFNSIFVYYPDLDIAAALQVNCDYASQNISLIDYVNRLISTLKTDGS
jgi:D-alanyl-D-alanine carboxypeptidase